MNSYSLEDPPNLDVLEQHPEVEELWLGHFRQISSLEPLRTLRNLRKLDLRTIASWDGTGRNLIVDSFEPLAALDKLEHIKMICVVPKLGRLEPLSRLANLRSLSISSNGSFYQLDDFAALSIALPDARESLIPVRPFMVCQKCRKYLTLLLNGAYPRQRKSACPSCGRKALIAHLERWNSLGGMPQYASIDELSPDELADVFRAHYPPIV